MTKSSMKRPPTSWVLFTTKHWAENKTKYGSFKDMLKDPKLKLEYAKFKK